MVEGRTVVRLPNSRSTRYIYTRYMHGISLVHLRRVCLHRAPGSRLRSWLGMGNLGSRLASSSSSATPSSLLESPRSRRIGCMPTIVGAIRPKILLDRNGQGFALWCRWTKSLESRQIWSIAVTRTCIWVRPEAILSSITVMVGPVSTRSTRLRKVIHVSRRVAICVRAHDGRIRGRRARNRMGGAW